MAQFSGLNVPELPHGHHELMTMGSLPTLLVAGKKGFFGFSNPSCYVSSRASHEVYKTFGKYSSSLLAELKLSTVVPAVRMQGDKIHTQKLVVQ